MSVALPLPAGAQVVSPPVAIGLPTQEWGLGYQPCVIRAGARLVATWSIRSFGSALPWATSSDGGGSWNLGSDLTPHPLIDPTVQVYGGGAATLASDGGGRTFLAYRIVGRYDLVHRVVVHRGSDSGGSWAWGPPVVAATVGAWEGTNADSPWLAIDPERGFLYLTYVALTLTNTLPINGPANQPVYFVRSLDDGQTWSAPALIGGPAALGSRVEVGAGGEVLVFWQDHLTKQVMLRRSEDFGVTFSAEQPVARFVDNSRTRMPGIRTGSFEGRGHPLNYFENGNMFDFPLLAVDRTSGPGRGTLYMVWAEAADGTLGPSSGRVVYETEPNDNTPATGNPIEFGDSFVSFGESERTLPPPDNDYFVFEGTRGRMFALTTGLAESPPDPSPFQAIRNPVMALDEATGLAPELFTGTSLKDGSAPPMIGSLPADGRYVIPGAYSGSPYSLTHFGTLLEFLPSPGSVARDHRDIVLTRSLDGGRTWSPKVRVNDDPPGTDQALPAVAVDGLGRVHVAWMDRRDGPRPGFTASPYWTVSLDGGLTFRPPLRLAAPGSDYVDVLHGDGGIGDFIELVPDAGGVIVAWPQVIDRWPTATMVRISDLPTSIAVPRFAAEPDGDAMRVTWTVQDPTGITGFAVHRAPHGTEDYELIAAVASHGTGEHAYTDRTVVPGERYLYRLQVQRGASSSWEGPVEAMLPLGIASLAFERVGPNPFERETRLVLAMPRRDQVDVRVYDVQGHEVRRLYTGEAPAGRHVLAWDGRDAGGREAAPGVYHLRAVGAGQRAARSIVRIR